MQKKTILLFLFEGYADWEISYAAAGISKSKTHRVRTLAFEKTPVRSMGGMTVLPDLDFRPQTDLTDIDLHSTSMLILPGGSAWEKGENDELASLIRHCLQQQIPVAAICGATLFLADLQLLDNRAHTSNSPDYLSSFSRGYNGQCYYKCDPVIVHDEIITAGGLHPVEFAEAVFDKLGMKGDRDVTLWFRYFRNKMVFFAN